MSATRSAALNAPFAYLDTLPIPIVISDPDNGNIFYLNQEFYNAYGYDPKEIIGSPISSLYHDPSDWDSIQKNINKNKKVKNYEVRNTHKDGTLRWTSLSVDTLQVEGGISALLSTFIDITEQRNADVIRQASAKLYQTIFNATPVMLWVKDTKNRTLQINQAAADFEGVDPKDVAGKSAYDLYPLEQAEAFYQDDLEVINSGQPKLGIIEEHTAVGKGDVMWVETGKVPIRDANGEITGVMAFAIDITESQKALERRGEQVDITTQVAQEIATADDINTIYQRVVTLVKERFGYYHTQIFTYNQNTDAMQLVVGYGKIGGKMRKAGHKLAVGHGVVGTAAATGKPALAADVTQDRNWRPNPNLPKTKGELAVPIKFQNEVLGILDVQSDRAGALTEDDVLLLENLAGQIAIAIENARLRDEMAIRIEEIESLYRSVRKAEGITKMDDQISLAFLPEKETVEHNVDQWLEDIEQTITKRKTNLDTSKKGNDAPPMIAPLNIHGDIVGALGIQPDDIDKLSEEDLEMLEAISDQVAQALENARLFNETKKRTEELASLNEIISAASQSLETETILETVMNKVLEITEFDGGLITMFNASRGELERAIRIGMPGKSPEDPAQGLDGSLCEHVYQNGKTMVIQDIATGTPKGTNAQGDIKAGLHGYIGIPVESKGRTLGTLCLFRYKNEPIPDNLVELTRT
jgi:PAS domain S-box-containing protein